MPDSIDRPGEPGGPRFARTKVGTLEVTSLLDGISAITVAHFPAAEPDRAEALRSSAGFGDEEMPLPFNAFHFVLDGRQYLVDAGNCRTANPLTGQLPEVMAEVGLDGAAIDRILITHGHVDHVAGLLDVDGKKLYPNAEIIIPRAELEFWGDAGKIGHSRPEIERMVKLVSPAFRAYAAQIRPFDGAPQIAPGLDAIDISGHTLAQRGYRLSSGGESLLFWGDIVHLAAFQLPEPDWSIVYDSDGPAAIATRRRILEMVTRDRLRVAGAHLPNNGIGMIEKAGSGYRFVATL